MNDALLKGHENTSVNRGGIIMGLSANQGLKIMAESLYSQARNERDPKKANRLISDANRLMRQYYESVALAAKRKAERKLREEERRRKIEENRRRNVR